MKLKGRRQSKNVEVQDPREGKTLVYASKRKRDYEASENSRLMSNKPVHKNNDYSQRDEVGKMNPGYDQQYGSAFTVKNMRTMKESHPTQKKLDKLLNNKKKKIEFLKVTRLD